MKAYIYLSILLSIVSFMIISRYKSKFTQLYYNYKKLEQLYTMITIKMMELKGSVSTDSFTGEKVITLKIYYSNNGLNNNAIVFSEIPFITI